MEVREIELMIRAAIEHEKEIEQAMLTKCETPDEAELVRAIYSHARVSLICLQHDIYLKELDKYGDVEKLKLASLYGKCATDAKE